MWIHSAALGCSHSTKQFHEYVPFSNHTKTFCHILRSEQDETQNSTFWPLNVPENMIIVS